MNFTKQKWPHNIAKHLMFTKRERWWVVRNEKVLMIVYTLLFIKNQGGPQINTA